MLFGKYQEKFKMNKKAAGIRPWVLSLVFVILGSFFILAFAFNFISHTNPDSEIFDAKYGLNTSMTTLQGNLDDFGDVANDVKSKLADSSPSLTDYIFLIFAGAFYIPWTFLSFAFNSIGLLIGIIFNTMGGIVGLVGFGVFSETFQGIMAVVLGVIFSGLLVTIVFLIVKAIRSGESER